MNDNSEPQSPIEAQLAAPPIHVDEPSIDALPSGGTNTSPINWETKVLQSRTAVLAILFFVTGALGIPLLWMNPKFSRIERIVWSIVVSLYTIVLVWITAQIVMWSYRQVFG